MAGLKNLLRSIGLAGLIGAVLPAAGSANTPSLLSDPIVKAVRRADCSKAVQELNSEVNSSASATALFIGGRMIDEGICVKKDPGAATEFFARSVGLGNQSAAIDYAAKVGLGEGTPPDYLQAGDICHKSGRVDAQGQISFYSLGYACTIGGIASRTLRETLPRGAFRLPTAPAIVEFVPATAQMRIISAPVALRADAPTGALHGDLLVNTRDAIEKAWSAAVSAAPKPDAASLGTEAVRLPIDLDTTLESSPNDVQKIDQMLPGDLLLNVPMPGPPH